MLIVIFFAIGVSVCKCQVEVTTQKIYWYKPFTDDPEILARNATIRRELVERIVPLGKSVQKMLETLPKGGGDKFIQELDEYNYLNEQFLNLVREDKANSKPEIDYVFDRIYPHIVDTDFPEDEMKKNFNWTSVDVEEFYKKREIANDHYIDINLYHHWYH